MKKLLIISLTLVFSSIYTNAQNVVQTDDSMSLMDEIVTYYEGENEATGIIIVDFKTDKNKNVVFIETGATVMNKSNIETKESIKSALSSLSKSDKKMLRENETYSFAIHY